MLTSTAAAKFRRWCCTLVSLSLISAWAQNVDPKKGRVTTNPTEGNRYSIEEEIRLGRQAAAEVEKKLPLLPATHPMSKFINTLGQNLAAKAPGYKFPYTFKVVREKSVNAFALPGGPIYVHTGLIELASESELAAVMGHEISHVVMRHSTRQATRQMKAQVPLAILGGILGAGVGGWAGALGQMGMQITAGSVFMKYSRDAETEADMVGAQIMYDAGYNPEAAVSFFKKLQQQGGKGGGPGFLNSHPDPGNRANNISSILSRFPPKQYAQSDSTEYVAAKQALSNVKEESPKQVMQEAGKAEAARLSTKNIASDHYTQFQHVAYVIDYPDNWQVSGTPDSSVTFYPDGGLAGSAVAYGVTVSGFQPKSKSNELPDAVQELIRDIRASNPGLREYNSPQNFSLQGRNAMKLDWLGTSAVRENGKALGERVRVVAVQGNSKLILYMIFVAPQPDFDGLSPLFDHMMNSFRVR